MVKTQSRRRVKGTGALRLLKSGRWQARAPHPTETVKSTGPRDPATGAPRVYVRPRMVSRSFESKVDAQAWLISPTFEDEDVAPDAQPDPLLRDYANEFLATRQVRGKSPLKPRTAEHYRRLLDAWILPSLGDLRLSQITTRKVDQWFADLDPDKATMRAHAYQLLHAILRNAVRQGLLATNPANIEGAGEAERKIQPQVLTVSEVFDLAEAMPPRYRAMVYVAAFCGLRFGELTELRRHDINVKAGVITVRRGVVRVGGEFQVGTPKSAAGVGDVPIPPPLLPEIEHHLDRFVKADKQALLFPAKNGDHLSASSLYKPFYAAREAIGKPSMRWHDLRHTSGTLRAQQGATLAEIQEHLRQSTAEAALRYQHAAQGRSRILADKMGDVIEMESRRRTASGT